MKPIELLEKTSLKDIFSDSEHQNYVTHGSYGGTKEESIFHGHGSTKDLKDIMRMKYFKHVDEYILEHVSKDQDYPVILLTNDKNYHDFMSITKNKSVMDQYIEGRIKTLSLGDISSKVKSIEEDVYKTFVDSRIKRYHDVLQSKQSSDDLVEINRALMKGKVETLIISSDLKMHLHFNNDSESMSEVILLAITNGSELVIANETNMQNDKNVIAIFRYI
jgi:hypothetical protein